MRARIKNLRLRTIIGIYDWEKEEKQDLVINVSFDFDGRAAAQSDSIEDTVDYKRITKRIIAHIEGNAFDLLEKLAEDVAGIVLDDDPRIDAVEVEADKPGALRFADSVSITTRKSRV